MHSVVCAATAAPPSPIRATSVVGRQILRGDQGESAARRPTRLVCGFRQCWYPPGLSRADLVTMPTPKHNVVYEVEVGRIITSTVARLDMERSEFDWHQMVAVVKG